MIVTSNETLIIHSWVPPITGEDHQDAHVHHGAGFVCGHLDGDEFLPGCNSISFGAHSYHSHTMDDPAKVLLIP